MHTMDSVKTTTLNILADQLADLHPDWHDYKNLFQTGNYKFAELLLLDSIKHYSRVEPDDIILILDYNEDAEIVLECRNRLRFNANMVIILEDALAVFRLLIK